jgi:hypothetical protein
MNKGTCIHYNGCGINESCKFGINYRVAFGTAPGILMRLPCIQYYERPAHGRGTVIHAGEPVVHIPFDRGSHKETPCGHYTEPTEDQIQAHRLEFDAYAAKMNSALRVVLGWKTRKVPTEERRAILECPVCQGKLHVSQSSYNGHAAAHCETDGCLSFRE